MLRNYQQAIQANVPVGHRDDIDLRHSTNDHKDIDAFKVHRKRVLETLKPHYHDIVAAYKAVRDYIDTELIRGGVFDPDSIPRLRGWGRRKSTNALRDYKKQLDLLETYIRSFEARGDEQVVGQAYEKPTAETDSRLLSLQRVRKHAAARKWRKSLLGFKNLVNRLDIQFLEIRQARLSLFAFDGEGDRGCGDFDVQAWRVEEVVDWIVVEPGMGPAPCPTLPIGRAARVNKSVRKAWSQLTDDQLSHPRPSLARLPHAHVSDTRRSEPEFVRIRRMERRRKPC